MKISVYSRMDRPIIVAEYDPRWPRLFEKERDLIRAALADKVIAIEHIGSTAVPGLPSKPTIDIGVGLGTLDNAAECIQLLERLGYRYEPDFEQLLPDRRFLWKGTRENHTHHIHMAAVGSDMWKRPILFRDYLRAHPDEALGYAELKKRLASRHSTDIDAYVEGKTAFVKHVLARIVND